MRLPGRQIPMLTLVGLLLSCQRQGRLLEFRAANEDQLVLHSLLHYDANDELQKAEEASATWALSRKAFADSYPAALANTETDSHERALLLFLRARLNPMRPAKAIEILRQARSCEGISHWPMLALRTDTFIFLLLCESGRGEEALALVPELNTKYGDGLRFEEHERKNVRAILAAVHAAAESIVSNAQLKDDLYDLLSDDEWAIMRYSGYHSNLTDGVARKMLLTLAGEAGRGE